VASNRRAVAEAAGTTSDHVWRRLVGADELMNMMNHENKNR
jgi:hypothetical protein